ncbi:MAG: adenine phosphoribosyltransferase [Chlamydiae bacterium]|nr:adenine phosphoribosyltransferase [Chlamydiota bacterium]MBI3276815.1 adenine phosphoribosyltransferase [Chlamydiota bacterium]
MRTLIDTQELSYELKKVIHDVPDFPKKGIIFKDITPLLMDGFLFQKTIQFFFNRWQDEVLDAIVTIESRGFFLGAPLAAQLGVGLIPVRKKGKLPRKTRKVSYQLEYGTDHLEIHEEDLKRLRHVLVVDDVLATGGTVSAVIQLLEEAGCLIRGIDFLMELTFLKGREKLKNHPVFSLLQY